MANQPTKYRKFLAGAATASLVATAVVPSALAANFSDVSENNSHKEHIDALAAAGIISGYEDGSFGPNNSLTRSHVVKMMGKWLVSLGHEVPADYKTVQRFEDISLTTKDEELLKYSALVKDKGVFNGNEGKLDPSSNITRENMAVVLVRAFDAVNGTDLVEYVKGQTFNRDVTDLNSAKAEARSAIDVLDFFDITNPAAPVFNPKGTVTRGQFASFLNKTIKTESPTPVDTSATKVATVSATNLKEVLVTFDGTVDKATASEAGNYSITGANSPEVDSAVVSEDAKSVILTIKGVFVNQNDYKLSVNNIKAGDKVLGDKDLAFKPLDNSVPTVSNVEALGNKTVRITFSEPVKPATTSQFLIDGKVVVGSIQTAGKSVIIKLSSALTDGAHTLTTEGVQDFNNFKTIKAENTFNVVEDKTAPTVASVVSASFEKVVLKFSEPVEQVFASNVYWMQGAAKKTASNVKQLSDDTYEFTFVGDNKLVYTTDLFVTNVKDYSGNVIDKDSKVQVSPVIDQTRPEVISSAFVKDSNNKQIVIKFTKSLDLDSAKKAANYVIKDKDGKVQYISSNVDVSKDKEVTITLLNNLKDNQDYTLSITGVSDNTTLKNVILPYTTTLSVKDVTAPTYDKVTRLNDRQLYVEFSEAMATSGDGSIVDSSKYTITNTGVTPNKTLSPASFNVTGDAKGVILSFNDDLPVAANISVKVQLVKDLAGNYLSGLQDTLVAQVPTATNIESVKAVATDKVQVKFNKALQSLNQADFSVAGNEISYSELSADGKTATFTLKSDLPEDVKANGNPIQLSVVASPQTVDILGEKIASNIGAKDITDVISATVDKIEKVGSNGNQIKITFNEAVTASAGANTDFVVKDNSGNTVGITSVTATGTELTITLAKSVIAATVSAKDVRFVEDAAENTIADIEATTVELGGDTQAPSVTTKLPAASTITADATHTLVFSEGLNDASKTAVKAAVDAAYVATAGGTATVSTNWNSAGTTLIVTITGADATNTVVVSPIPSIAVTDLAGNTSTALALQ